MHIHGLRPEVLERQTTMSNAPTTRKRESDTEAAVVDFTRAKRVRRSRKGRERVSLRTAREAIGMRRLSSRC
jgi:hypothetical protein